MSKEDRVAPSAEAGYQHEVTLRRLPTSYF